MARIPAHPRLARMLIEARDRGVIAEAALAAALISSGERLDSPDLLDALDRTDIHPHTRVMQRRFAQLLRRGAGWQPARDCQSRSDLCIAVLTAFPDRVARRRSDTDAQLSNNRTALLPSADAPAFMTVIDLEERREAGAPRIRLYCPAQPDWLLDLFPDRLRERTELTWNRTAERVEAQELLLYDELILDQRTNPRPRSPEVSAQLAQKALEAGIERFIDAEALDHLLARAAFAAEQGIKQAITRDDAESMLRELASGLSTLADLRIAAQQIIPALKARVPSLDEWAPERFPLKGRQVKIHYVPGQPPWIASRLQDFFGMKDGPRIARGKVPLLIHLLAPNQRPVQMTTDLAGFWQRLYPQVRKELSRRYPKHKWPEDPLSNQ